MCVRTAASIVPLIVHLYAPHAHMRAQRFFQTDCRVRRLTLSVCLSVCLSVSLSYGRRESSHRMSPPLQDRQRASVALQ